MHVIWVTPHFWKFIHSETRNKKQISVGKQQQPAEHCVHIEISIYLYVSWYVSVIGSLSHVAWIPRGNTQGKRCAAEAFKPCPVKDVTCKTGYCFGVFQACEGKREVSKECQTHLTGEGAEKVSTYFFCAFPLRPCLALLAYFTLAFARFCSSEKGEKITPVMQAI